MDIDPTRTAVLAIHLQGDVVSADGAFGGLFAAEVSARGVLATVGELINAARAAGAAVVYTRVAFRPDGSDLVANMPLLQMAAQAGCLQDGSPLADVVAEVGPEDDDVVITHQRLSGFVNSDLDLQLRSRGIDTLLVTGVATNLSVESAARHAADLGYRTIVVSDACSAADEATHDASLASLGVVGEIATSKDVVAALATG